MTKYLVFKTGPDGKALDQFITINNQLNTALRLPSADGATLTATKPEPHPTQGQLWLSMKIPSRFERFLTKEQRARLKTSDQLIKEKWFREPVELKRGFWRKVWDFITFKR